MGIPTRSAERRGPKGTHLHASDDAWRSPPRHYRHSAAASMNAMVLKPSHLWRTLLILPLAALYAPVFADLGRAWWHDQYAGHGMFVPAFSAFLAWGDRERTRAALGQGNAAGILVTLAALAILAAGWWSGSLLVQTVSVMTAVAGVVLWTLGERCLRTLAFPVGFLLFMAPLPTAIVDSVTIHLQVFAARVAGVVLEMLDVPFYQSGVDIVLPAMKIQVAEVCNGLRFLMALLVITKAFASVPPRTT